MQKKQITKKRIEPFLGRKFAGLDLDEGDQKCRYKETHFDTRDEAFLITLLRLFWTNKALIQSLLTMISEMKIPLQAFGFQLKLLLMKSKLWFEEVPFQ